jgi:pyruvate formate lyase activating enzyme
VRNVAFTYNDPVIFLEYAIDVADACRELGLRAVAVNTARARTETVMVAMPATMVVRSPRR